jgi:predicted metal-binding membrane protein
MSAVLSIESLFRHSRAITWIALALVCALAWLYVLMGAGSGMSPWDMTTLSPLPHRDAPEVAVQVSAWSTAMWVLMIAMWWIMMIAMMVPSAAPTILLYDKVRRAHVVNETMGESPRRLASTGAFTFGYLLAWFGFAVIATLAQWALERSGLLSVTTMGSQSRWWSGAVLIGAGLYQFVPLKYACLSHCRAPAGLLVRHWRPRATGALWLGALHGAYCVGCCWALMALLFVGGVMNVAWIAVLSVLVMMEKLLRAGHWISRGVGCVLVAWGFAAFVV